MQGAVRLDYLSVSLCGLYCLLPIMSAPAYA